MKSNWWRAIHERQLLDCGGKSDATPLSHGQNVTESPGVLVRPKAPSPLRSAGALQNINLCMNSTHSHPKKSPASKARRKTPVGPRCRAAQTSRSSPRDEQNNGAAQQRRPTTLRRGFRAWRASLPTALERDTMLMPDAIATSVVQEAEQFLNAELPENFAERLAAKAHRLYPRHQHFHKMLNRPGNLGRDNLYMYMRHWTAGWLKRERPALYKKLPWSFGQGRPLPATAPGGPKHHPGAKQLVTADCIKPALLEVVK